MSATAFLRHRRAVAVKIILDGVKRAPKKLAGIMAEFSLTPADLGTLDKNNDVLLIADRITAEKLDEPELDSLEELNVVSVGDRASVHSPDVHDDQFEDMLQHPAQETVGVGNMHDGPEAAESLMNLSKAVIDDHDGSYAEAAAAVAKDDSLADHAGLPEALPEVHPSLDPAKNEVTAEDAQTPTDPDGTQDTAATPVDLDQAAAALATEEKADASMVKAGMAALDSMDRDALVAYAASNDIDLGNVRARATPASLRTRIKAALKPAEEA